MNTYISILRGINVGGHRKIKMDALRKMCAGLGFQNVQTYIQSGNIAFQSTILDEKELEKKITAQIKTDFGHDVPVMVKQSDEITRIFEQNPFLNEGREEKTLHVTFLSEKPEKEDVDRIKDTDFKDDKFQIIDKAVYLHIPGSYYKTKLSNSFFEKQLKRKATTRNWKTVTKLFELGISS